jgi:hypothetical protein
MAWIVALVFVLLAPASMARAACTPDCSGGGTYSAGGPSTRAPYCTGNAVNTKSVKGDTLGINLGYYAAGDQYVCGQYADQTWWIQARGAGTPAVVVSGTTPAAGNGQNGYMANPGPNENRLDNRGAASGPANNRIYQSPVALPATFAASAMPVSFVKARSRPNSGTGTSEYPCADGVSRSCIEYVDVFTFVSAPPDSDGDGLTSDEFRPGWAGSGAEKLRLNTSAMDSRLADWPSLSRSGLTLPSLTGARDALQHPHPQYMYGVLNRSDIEVPVAATYYPGVSGSGRGYQGDVNTVGTTAILRLLFDDVAPRQESPRSPGRQGLINWAQRGLDYYQLYKLGHAWGWDAPTAGWGGIFHGHKVMALGAARLLGHSALVGMIQAGERVWFEDMHVYRSTADNRVYWGITTHSFCSNAGTCGSGSPFCAARSNTWDANCCANTDKPGYPFQHLNGSSGWKLIVELTGSRALWDNNDSLELYERSWAGTRGPGHVKKSPAGQYCGANNQGGNTNRDVIAVNGAGYYRCNLCEQMWPKFGTSSSPPPPDPGPDPTPEPEPEPTPQPLPPPVQLTP